MITFKVFGTPKPQSRPKAFSRGKFTSVYSPVTAWRNDVKYAAHKVFEDQGQIDGAVIVEIEYYFRRPKSHYGTGKNSDILKASAPKRMTKRPDLDNLNKAVLDAIQDSNLLKDDSAVVRLISTKHYVFRDYAEGARIKINPIEGKELLSIDWTEL
jgi:Holliday junction resolvase RusA-like endonuclease